MHSEIRPGTIVCAFKVRLPEETEEQALPCRLVVLQECTVDNQPYRADVVCEFETLNHVGEPFWVVGGDKIAAVALTALIEHATGMRAPVPAAIEDAHGIRRLNLGTLVIARSP